MNGLESGTWNPERSQLLEQLRTGRLFQGLASEHLESMIEKMTPERFSPDEVIVRQDTITRNIWMLVEGQCEVTKEPPLGEFGWTVPLAQLGPLDVFGEMTIFDAEPHVASVTAKSDVRTVRLRGEDLDELMDSHPDVACRLACNLVRILSGRLRSVDAKLSRSLDRGGEDEVQQAWTELRGRLGKLYAGAPR